MVLFESEERRKSIKEHLTGVDLILHLVEIIFLFNPMKVQS